MSEIFDPKTFTDEQLFNKHVDLVRRRVMTTRMGFGNAAYQLDMMIQAVENERRERMYLEHVKRLPTSPVVVDTDPQPQDEREANKTSKAETTTTTINRPIRRPIRSRTPVIPDGD